MTNNLYLFYSSHVAISDTTNILSDVVTESRILIGQQLPSII